jgi:DNA processing protein
MNLFQKKPVTENETLSFLRLARTDRIGPITALKLLERFGSAQNVLEALPELSKAGGKKFDPASLASVEKELTHINKCGGQIITLLDPNYPEQLAAIDDAPLTLTVLGDISLLKQQQLAIVGARAASLNGRKLTSKLAKDAVAHELVITSGLARGIDTAAHQGALEAQGKTIAVVAGGIDQIYPRENEKLFHEIVEKGAVIAESPYGTAPSAHLFPRRNRVVSGLSEGALVIEATERSGSLITARLAAEQGREVMAVPGYPNDPRAAGPNRLIRDGATLIRNIEDVLDQLQRFQMIKSAAPKNNIFEMKQPFETLRETDFSSLEQIQETLLLELTTQPIGIDELIRACHISIAEGQTAILALELAGRVMRLTGNRICKLEA